MINWIQFLYRNFDVRGFNIIDDNFTFDMDYAKKFCMEIIKLGYKDIEINTHMGTRMERTDPQLYGLMKKAGWRYVVVAPESGSERVLNLMGKKLNLSIVPNIIRDIKKSGLKVHGFFMIGYPGEAEGDLLKTEMFIRQNRFNNGISVSRFQPYPGTPIFKELVERGEIPQDFLPTHYGKYNEAKYTPRELEGFDFEGFVHKLQRINDPLLTYKIMGRSLLRYPWRMYKRIFRGSSE
jgi:radical SAM superfamily enzyme YgiQ (UPF0313 family)